MRRKMASGVVPDPGAILDVPPVRLRLRRGRRLARCHFSTSKCKRQVLLDEFRQIILPVFLLENSVAVFKPVTVSGHVENLTVMCQPVQNGSGDYRILQ